MHIGEGHDDINSYLNDSVGIGSLTTGRKKKE